ncbi:oligosaccharide flippase family protein [Collinsella aerofaciens]|uniref:oligosaccharide flippase family protein n=1 Tax=Collinsella aerofaciens TaxID=74426 RepID=UPI00136882A7|nr:oligosaccharide flippase family protein [Collinsella aerofaciens]MZJ31668.1 oligosaccharide flippase family protein [Collinsella aerofaciens]MZJ36030.1 oligosaccharide flippase family protein [Collinsella aerofaciens]MZJ37946.1 oligosaccharide flippase family protein [Collinsella aerofaciens]MZJ41716.1 oligosaccharide flippase family protein [Collinsella aerofaciens]MZJ43499.1 oligosaccharide flippase family protein [Collinsella aerofaciens]
MLSVKHNTFYKNTLWQYGLQILKYLFPLLLIPYLTRILGTEGYAVYAYVLSFMGVVQTIADFGFTLSGTKKVVDLRGDTAALSRLVGAITVARLMLLCGLFFCVMVVTRFIPIMAENTVYVIWAFFATAGRTVLPDFIFQGNERMGPLTTRYFASKGVQVALTILLVRGPGDLILVAVADVLSEIVDIAWSYRAQKRLFGVGIARPTFKESFEELRVSAIYCVSNVSSSLFSGFTTVIIGLAITSKTDIAFWSLTLTTVNAVQSLYTPIANSLYPHMIKNRDFGFARKLALVALPVLVLGIVAYCALSKPIMLVLGGPEYVGGAHVMWMISPIFIFSFYGILIGWPVLGAMGHVKELTVSTLFTGIVNVVSLLALYLAGLITLDVICVARWGCDALLLLVRVFMLWRVARSKTDFHKNPKE